MRKQILIAAALLFATSAHADEARGLVVSPATPADAPVIMSLEQQQAAAQPAAPQASAQQPPTPTEVINRPYAQQLAPQQQPLPPQQAQPTPEQQAEQQKAMRQQQIQQQRRAQQARMQREQMMRQRMAQNMSVEQKVAYKVHQVKTQVKMTLIKALR